MGMVNTPFALYPALICASQQTVTLDLAEEHVAYVIRAPKTGTIKKIGWRVNASTSPSGLDVYVAMETVADAVGVPVATSRGAATLFAAGAESAKITDPSVGARFDALNGTTGVAVTKGDLFAVTIRCTAVTSGSIGVAYDQFGYGLSPFQALSGDTYTYAYTGSGAVYGMPTLTLEYDGEIVVTPTSFPALSTVQTSVQYNSGSNPDRRGLKFKFPNYGCVVRGCLIQLDQDVNVDLILYGADEYTVVTGFPVTLDKDKRRATSLSIYYVEFPTDVTFLRDTWYRLVALPKDTTNIAIATYVPADDGALLGMNAFHEGLNVAYTTFNGAPSSGSHSWTDDATKRVNIALMISQIDIPASDAVLTSDTVGGAAGHYTAPATSIVKNGENFGVDNAEVGTYAGGGGPLFGDRTGGKY